MRYWTSILSHLLLLFQSYSQIIKTPQDFRVEGLSLAPNAPQNLSLGYSGFFPVRQGAGQLFFWYFEAKKKADSNTPVVIWLQGGPGASSMIGLFNLHGPLQITEDFKIQAKDYSWNEEYDTIYLDQPVGSGYSYVNPVRTTHNSECFNSGGYNIDQCGIRQDLIEFLVQFGKVFPSIHKRPLYLTGESYAGKYLPTFADAILEYNKGVVLENKFKLKGFAIGDGLTDPETQIEAYAPLALSLGLATMRQYKHISMLSNRAKVLAQGKKWNKATRFRNKIFDYYRNVTNGVDYYDVRNGVQPHGWKHMETYLNLPEVKKALHVPYNVEFIRDPKVLTSMEADIMKSVVNLFPGLTDLNILLFQGQFDYRDGPMSQYKWMYKTFPCLKRARRKTWMIGNDTAGYITRCHNQKITHTVVLQAGHMVSLTQPVRGLDLINKFINNVF